MTIVKMKLSEIKAGSLANSRRYRSRPWLIVVSVRREQNAAPSKSPKTTAVSGWNSGKKAT